MNIKNKALWTCIAIALAALTIWAVFSMSGNMSPAQLLDQLKTAKPGWLFLAVLSMLGIIFFEGEAILAIIGPLGYPRSHWRGFIYGSADIYFSAITPSASGGQPASAFFMIQDGIPGAIVTAALILNLVMYTLVILSIGLVCLISRPAFFLRFQIISRLLIVFGTLALSGLAVLFFLLLFKQRVLFGISRRFIRYIHKKNWLKHPEKPLKKLDKAQKEYADCVMIMRGETWMLIKAFIMNLLQRLSQFSVIICMYMATGGSLKMIPDLFATQCYIILGSNCIPVPGGMGITDFLMLDGYGQLFDRDYSFQLEILGRSMSFYCSLLVSGITVVIGYWLLRRRKKAQKKKQSAGAM